MHRLALWREANEQEANRCNNQRDLTDHRKDRDERIATEQ
jgi:hypothetical protein